MNRNFLKYLVCPETNEDLELINEEIDNNGLIKSGELKSSKKSYKIIDYIPRFVKKDYASNFGYQWNIHNETQLDKKNSFNISKKRFFETTNWSKDLGNELILEAGSGMGRFTEHALSTNATVISIDMSSAVEANYKNNKSPNLFIVQADIYSLPFRKNLFDKIFCFGVLQHTPNPKKSFNYIKEKLKSKGEIVIDVYRKHLYLSLIHNSKTRPETRTRHWFRYFTKKVNEKKLYNFVKAYVRLLWPLCTLLNFIPFGKYLSWLLCIADYRNVPQVNISSNYLEWAILDTYDMLSPEYDNPQTKAEVEKWFLNNEFSQTSVRYGYNGIEASGVLK